MCTLYVCIYVCVCVCVCVEAIVSSHKETLGPVSFSDVNPLLFIFHSIRNFNFVLYLTMFFLRTPCIYSATDIEGQTAVSVSLTLAAASADD